MILNPTDKEVIGEKIQKRREELGLSQEELGARIGAQKNSISRYECGAVEPKAGILFKIAAALDTSTACFSPEDYRKEYLIGKMYIIDKKLSLLPPEKQEIALQAITAMLDGMNTQLM